MAPGMAREPQLLRGGTLGRRARQEKQSRRKVAESGSLGGGEMGSPLCIVT